MKTPKKNNIFASLDIGTTKIVCVISLLDSNGNLSILGLGSIPSESIRKGIVTNIDKTASAIRETVKAAEGMAGDSIDDVWVGVSGEHIRYAESTGIVAIRGKNNEVAIDDVMRAIESAKTASILAGREILHTIPQEFILDGQGGIEQPVGMIGERLEMHVCFYSGTTASIQSLRKSVGRSGLSVAGLVMEPMACCYAVLEKPEKELGVALVDIGGSATSIAVWLEDKFQYAAVLGFGSGNITRDIARGLQIPAKTAEEIKIRYGCAHPSLAKRGTQINLRAIGGRHERKILRERLASLIKLRIEGMLSLVRDEIRRAGYEEKLAAGIVLTGGGALLEGTDEVAERVFERPVRIGIPSGLGGIAEFATSPAYATAIGLCWYAAEHAAEGETQSRNTNASHRIGRAYASMKTWIKDFL